MTRRCRVRSGVRISLARVRAALRRSVQRSEQPGRLRIGGTEVDLTRRQASGPQGELHLTPLEYRVLETLSYADGMIVRQDQLIAKVWGPDRIEDTRSLSGCIANLRSNWNRIRSGPDFC